MNRTHTLIGMYSNLILATVTTLVPVQIVFLVLSVASLIMFVIAKD
jgi:hypothetical protein